jgi:uroporphyrinogen-III synthase
MKVIVTRPRLEADVWVNRLREKNIDAVALPLIQISSVSDKTKIKQAWAQLLQYRAIMFVSGNAVRYFFDKNIEIADVLYDKFAINNIVNNAVNSVKNNDLTCRMWATGPGTQEALLAQALPADMIDAPAPDAVQFDSEALWSCVKNQVNAGDKVLIVRGGTASDQIDRSATVNGRPWLADQLSAMGVQVDMVVSYQRGAPVFDAAEKALMAQASGDGSIWLLSSSEAVANLKAIAGLNWTKATAVTTHPRIAQAAREAGFGVVYESRPTLADVSASIESLL